MLSESMQNFVPLYDYDRLVTEEELIEVYGVTDSAGRRQLMQGVEIANKESDYDMDSSVSTTLIQYLH